ncbi:hypothetical protein E8E15_011628 [Penicillium rubens]|uniref:Uncharacterized protein n=1 Tax=Penicillium chrysogenum TaxID=5076 RepID=A0A167XCQ2_PENCH|nr:hypothetical protein E8E15_011628 [Penicillium rubens]KZN92673.1 hypothetical protein EN45_028340 [Penicillium chrysogenum]
MAYLALGNNRIPRVKALGLWFADIKALEVLVGHKRNPHMLRYILVDFCQYNLPRIWASDGQAPATLLSKVVARNVLQSELQLP